MLTNDVERIFHVTAYTRVTAEPATAASDTSTATATSGTTPAVTPTLAVVNDGTGNSFTVTFVADDETDIMHLSYKRAELADWTDAERTGSGDKQITGLKPGIHDVLGYAEDDNGFFSAPTSLTRLLVIADSGEFEALTSYIRARFKTFIADAESLATQYDNDGGFVKPNDGLWCRWTVLPGESRQASTGASKRYRTPGVAIASVFVPMSEGESALWPIVDAINLAFRGITADGVRYLIPKVSKVGRTGTSFQANVTCPFESDVIS
jgi:hypothetical protein